MSRVERMVAVCSLCARKAGWATKGSAFEFSNAIHSSKCAGCKKPIGISAYDRGRWIDKKDLERPSGR